MTDSVNVTVMRVVRAETHLDTGLEHLSVISLSDKRIEDAPDTLSQVDMWSNSKTAIAGKLEDGSHRYPAGSLAVFFPIGVVIPLPLLKEQGFYWDAEKDRGLLKGSKRNRVGAVTRGSVTSEGILFPLKNQDGSMGTAVNATGGELEVMLGDIINEFYGIE